MRVAGNPRLLGRDDGEVAAHGVENEEEPGHDPSVTLSLDFVKATTSQQGQEFRLGQGDREFRGAMGGSTSWMSTPFISSVR